MIREIILQYFAPIIWAARALADWAEDEDLAPWPMPPEINLIELVNRGADSREIGAEAAELVESWIGGFFSCRVILYPPDERSIKRAHDE